MKSKCVQIVPYGVVLQIFKNLPKSCLVEESEDSQFLGLTWKDQQDDLVIGVWVQSQLFDKIKDPKKQKLVDVTKRQIIVHECVHIKQFLEEAIDSKLDKETEAYLTSWLCCVVEQTLEDLNK